MHRSSSSTLNSSRNGGRFPAPATPMSSKRKRGAELDGLPSIDESDGEPAWLNRNRRLHFASGSIRAGRMRQDSDLLQIALNWVIKLTLWPVTLSLMLIGTLYRFCLHVGTSSSPLRFREPSRWLVQVLSLPFRVANPPVVLGVENLKDAMLGQPPGSNAASAAPEGVANRRSPALFVGNLAMLGLDCVTLLDQVQSHTGVYPRVLYDVLFGYIPGLRQAVELAGGVRGTLTNCKAVMTEGRCLMLFPGGAREMFKSSADKYKLMWNDKLGFVRIAIKYGYAIIPFASVGTEDAAKVAFTVNLSWIVRQVDKNHGPMRIPILYPYNSLERQYFAFGKAIDTSRYGGYWENSEKCVDVYLEVKEAVERLIQRLQCVQKLDPDRYLLNRTWRSCRNRFAGLLGGRGKAGATEPPKLAAQMMQNK